MVTRQGNSMVREAVKHPYPSDHQVRINQLILNCGQATIGHILCSTNIVLHYRLHSIRRNPIAERIFLVGRTDKAFVRVRAARHNLGCLLFSYLFTGKINHHGHGSNFTASWHFRKLADYLSVVPNTDNLATFFRPVYIGAV